MTIKNLLFVILGCIIMASCKKLEHGITPPPADTTGTDTGSTDTTGTDTVVVQPPLCSGEAELKQEVTDNIGTAYGSAPMLTADTAGNVYMAAFVNTSAGSIDADPGPGVISITGAGILVVKLDTGMHVTWAKLIPDTFSYGSNMDVTAFGNMHMQVDDKQDIFISFNNNHRLYGIFMINIILDPGGDVIRNERIGYAPVMYTAAADAAGNAYNTSFVGPIGTTPTVELRKYNVPAGAISYSKNLVGFVKGLAGESSTGAVYITGTSYNKNADFDSGPGVANVTVPDGVTYYIYLEKLDASGNLLWVKYIGDNGDSYPLQMKIYADNDGVLLTGLPMIEKFTPSGTLEWQKPIDLSGSADLAFDKAHNIYAITPGGGANITKFSASGDMVWTRPAFGEQLAFKNGRNIFTLTSFTLRNYTICP